MGCWLAADLGYLLVEPTDSVAALTDLGYLVGGLLLGASAWRRPASAMDSSDPAPETASRAVLQRLVLAGFPLAIPLTLLVGAVVNHRDVRESEALAGMTLIFGVVFLRIARLLQLEARSHVSLALARDEALEHPGPSRSSSPR